MIKNSVGSKLFRNLYFDVDGRSEDILKNGDISCSRFVSVILHSFYLLDQSHATVSGLITDMEKSEWKKIDKPRIGAVLIWEARKQNRGTVHRHPGFYVDNGKAISHRDIGRVPTEHDWEYKGEIGINSGRKVEAIYWHKKLDK